MTSRWMRYTVIAACAVAAGLVLTPLAEAQYEAPAGGMSTNPAATAQAAITLSRMHRLAIVFLLSFRDILSPL